MQVSLCSFSVFCEPVMVTTVSMDTVTVTVSVRIIVIAGSALKKAMPIVL